MPDTVTLREKFDDRIHWAKETLKAMDVNWNDIIISDKINFCGVVFGGFVKDHLNEKSYYFREQNKLNDFPSLKKMDKYNKEV